MGLHIAILLATSDEIVRWRRLTRGRMCKDTITGRMLRGSPKEQYSAVAPQCWAIIRLDLGGRGRLAAVRTGGILSGSGAPKCLRSHRSEMGSGQPDAGKDNSAPSAKPSFQRHPYPCFRGGRIWLTDARPRRRAAQRNPPRNQAQHLLLTPGRTAAHLAAAVRACPPVLW